MTLPIGTIVRNLHTGDEGRIIALDGDIAMVELFDDGDNYPIPLQSLVRSEAFFGTIAFEKGLGKAKKSENKAQKSHLNPYPPLKKENSAKNDAIPTIFAVFAPNLAEMPQLFCLSFFFDEKRDIFVVFAVNNTNYSIKFETVCKKNYTLYWDFKNLIEPYNYYPIGELPRLALNESPQVCAEIPMFHKKIETQLRAKSFFTTLRLVLIDATDIKNSQKPPEKPLKIQAQAAYKAALTTQKTAKKTGQYVNLHDLQLFASFPLDIDLHAEILFAQHAPPANDILRQQLLAFQAYLEKAIRLNIPRVNIIHGKGEGILRQEIWKLLKVNKNVISFDINSDIKYGGGATEVVL